ncbi:type IV pilus assembly protein FimV [Deefgea piscis]|uniref:type IV pilus assembly protein FimV n=1 Tax=Deefgea piscis TaxID=2739061 RepID=UPI001C8108FB|nr:hypothetical protein [Deefgea piscis]QZA81930.1 hypothetical protein K4H25_04575 [Deefgea piscis]
MIRKLHHLLRFPQFIFVFAAMLMIAAGARAAMLGDLRVYSALGEQFSASVAVAALEEETLSSQCFRLVGLHSGEEQNVLRRAKLVFQPDGAGGRLLVQGLDAWHEPILNFAVRVKCPGEENRVFQRDYSVLLDPHEYQAPNKKRNASINPPISQRDLPRLGSVWLTEEGDTVANIARRYYPNQAQLRTRFVERLYELNPDLPQGTTVRLGNQWRVQLPAPITNPNPKTKVTSAQHVVPLATEARLSLTPANPPAEAVEPLAAPAADGEFRLRLSLPALDLKQKNNLSPAEILRLREGLLSLESDEQAAQMLQLKDQIKQLEQQLHQVSGAKVSPAAKSESKIAEDVLFSWQWFLFLGLIGLAIAVLIWRQRQRITEDTSYSALGVATLHGNPTTILTQRTPSHFPHSLTRTSGFMTEETPSVPEYDERDERDWRNEAVDVVSPNSVAEEAQLLLDYGMQAQAIQLLSDELLEHPHALALWMKLLEVFAQENMLEAFQERAVAFRLQFASDSLWQQVQSMGQQIDVNNPLYQSLDARSAAHSLAHAPVEGAAINSANLAPILAASPVNSDLSTAQQDAFHFDLDLLPTANANERGADQLSVFAAQQDREIDASLSSVVSQRRQFEAKDFVSDDATLQEIAVLIADDQRREAFERLEMLLYKGTMPQRLSASKWLDKLLSHYGQP